jgi:hypothetical protein
MLAVKICQFYLIFAAKNSDPTRRGQPNRQGLTFCTGGEMPTKRIKRNTLSALIASYMAFASIPVFAQERIHPEPVRIAKRSPSLASSRERVTLTTQQHSGQAASSTSRPLRAGDRAVVKASARFDSDEHASPARESIEAVAEPTPIYEHDSWGYSSMSGGCDDGCGHGTQVYIDTGIFGSILNRTKVRVEGATFWGKGYNLQPLITAGPSTESITTVGQIGRPGTRNLFGGGEVLNDSAQGIRVSADFSLDCHGHQGILFRMFRASEIDNGYTNAGTNEPVVVRPFFSPDAATPATIVVNYPAGSVGTIDASINSRVYGGDLLFRNCIGRDCSGALDFLIGYQLMRLDEGLSITSSSSPAPFDTTLDLQDRFSTSNRFHAFALGLDSTMRSGCWSLNTLVKLGMGNVEREIDINGFQRITVLGQPPSIAESTQGLLARSTNNGSYRSNRFVVSPEVALTLGYRFSRQLDATLTYTYIGLPKVARVGEQLDPDLIANLNNPPSGLAAPRFLEASSNYSLHSLSYGLQWKY